MTFVRGQLYKLYVVDGASRLPFTQLTTSSEAFTSDLEDVTTKDTPNWKEYLPSRNDLSFSIEGKVDPTAQGTNKNLVALREAISSRALLDVVHASETLGNPETLAACYLANLDVTMDDGSTGTYSATLQNTGTPTLQATA
jgi:hypothetical protein